MTISTEMGKSQSDHRRNRAEMRDSLPVFAFVIAGLGISILADPHGVTAGNLMYAFVQMAAVLWMVWVQVRSLARADEYQRVVRLEALAVGFAAVMVVIIAAGVLDALGVGRPRQSLQVAPIVGVLAWTVAHGLRTKRAR